MFDFSFLDDSKYSRWYIELCISRSKNAKIKNETEMHHVKPKSIETNDAVVNLTHREHFVAHWLLTKCVKKRYKHKMLKAISAMSFAGKAQQRKAQLTSMEYSVLRAKHLESLSKPCSKDRKNSIKQARKNSPKYECEFCLKKCDGGNYKQHHGERCKLNPNVDQSILEAKRLTNKLAVRKSIENGNFKGSENIRKNIGPFICPHCNVEGSNLPNMKRNHFDRCKSKMSL